MPSVCVTETLKAPVFGTLNALSKAWQRAGQHTLRISIQETDTTVGLTLEGRLAGPWVAELNRAWRETAPRLGEKLLSMDLRNLTYSDASGKHLLREIFRETSADIVTSSPWSQYLADEVRQQ